MAEEKITKATVEETVGEIVQITRGQLQGILAEIENLKRGQLYEKPKRVTEHFARLRFYNGKPVIWYGNVREKLEKETGDKKAWMDIKLFEGNEKITVPYLDFLNSRNEFANNAVNVKILEQKAEKIVESEGHAMATNPNPHFDKKWEPFDYEQEIVKYEYQATIEILDGEHRGKIFTLPSACLNA